MLWYKGWLETRYRLLFCIGWATVFLALVHPAHTTPMPLGAKGSVFSVVMLSCPMVVLVGCAMLGGSGVVTQPTLQAAKGLHGSTLYTLSLPVSRVRLLAVRASVGWLEIIGLVSLLCVSLWVLAPALRTVATPLQVVKYAATIIACGSMLYGVSVLLATFLDDQWRTWGAMGIGVGLWWLCGYAKVPEATNIFRAMREGSPLMAHAMPWGAMGFSVAMGVALVIAAAKVVQAREY